MAMTSAAPLSAVTSPIKLPLAFPLAKQAEQVQVRRDRDRDRRGYYHGRPGLRARHSQDRRQSDGSLVSTRRFGATRLSADAITNQPRMEGVFSGARIAIGRLAPCDSTYVLRRQHSR